MNGFTGVMDVALTREQAVSEEIVLIPPPYLSPSSMGTFNQCPQKFKFNKIDMLPDSPTKETLLGNFVHEVLEFFYAMPSESRTKDVAKSLASQVWLGSNWEERVKPFVPNPDEFRLFRWNAWWCIEHLWDIEDPTLTEPAGIETELNGELAGVSLKGFIDRYSINDETLTISDYKTGKTPKKHYVDDKFLQLKIYATLSEAIGMPPTSSIELLYLKDGVVFKAPLTDSDKYDVIKYVTSTKARIDEACDTHEFPANRSILCDWCSYRRVCPAWKK
jgi:putative RecB family exonuclease